MHFLHTMGDFPASYVSLSESNSSCDSLVGKCQVLQKKTGKKKELLTGYSMISFDMLQQISTNWCSIFAPFLVPAFFTFADRCDRSRIRCCRNSAFRGCSRTSLGSNKWDPNIHGEKKKVVKKVVKNQQKPNKSGDSPILPGISRYFHSYLLCRILDFVSSLL